MNKLLFLFYYYHYYLHLYQEIYYFLILCLNSGRVVPLNTHIEPYGSHTVMGGQHWNHRGPISVSHGSHLGPNYVSRKYHFSRIISILSRGSHILECIFIVIKFYQYGTYKGLIWAKKPIWGPSRTQMG